MRIVTIFTGILSVAVAIWCFVNQGAVFVSVAFIVGIMMILSGLCEVRGYFAVHRKMGHAAYILTEGGCDVILGALVLANCVSTEAEVPIFFGMWVLFSGALRAATALNSSIKKTDESIYMLVVGILSMAVGIYSFWNTVLLGVPNVLLIAICFLIKGINTIATGIEMPKKKTARRRHGKEKKAERAAAAQSAIAETDREAESTGKTRPAWTAAQKTESPEGTQPAWTAARETESPEGTQPAWTAARETESPEGTQPAWTAARETESPEKTRLAWTTALETMAVRAAMQDADAEANAEANAEQKNTEEKTERANADMEQNAAAEALDATRFAADAERNTAAEALDAARFAADAERNAAADAERAVPNAVTDATDAVPDLKEEN